MRAQNSVKEAVPLQPEVAENALLMHELFELLCMPPEPYKHVCNAVAALRVAH